MQLSEKKCVIASVLVRQVLAKQPLRDFSLNSCLFNIRIGELTPDGSSPLPYAIISVFAIAPMDPEFLKPPGQGVSDLQACYDHALSGLIKAGTDLDQVGTELNRAQITFYNAIDDYFKQLQLQIDNKNKAIRLMLEQKIEIYSVMSPLQNELVKLQDENTTLRTRNEYLTGILTANSSGTGDLLPPGTLQENFSGISSTDLFCPRLIIHNSRNLQTILTALKTTYYMRPRTEHLVHYLIAHVIQL